MREGTAASRGDDQAWAIEAIRRWTADHKEILGGLVALRSMGDEARSAVDVVLGLRELNRFRLEFELWETLVHTAGGDADDLLLRGMPYDAVNCLREGLFGTW